MKAWSKRLIVLALVAAMAFGVIDTAAAQGPNNDGGRRGVDQADRVLRAVMNAFGEATGLTLRDVLPDLVGGSTLSEILVANGLDPEAVAADVKAELTAEIESAVANGHMTQTAADRLLANLDTVIERVMNSPLPQDALRSDMRDRVADRIGEMVDNTLAGTVAEMSGLTVRDVIAAWREAGTLAAVVEANGLDVTAVLDATEAEITERVGELVAQGTLDEDRAAAYLENLRDRLEARMNVTVPLSDAIRERAADAVDHTLLGVLAEMAGSTPAEVLRDAVTPPTMAEVATELGLDPDAVIDEAVARITETVNQAVADGKLSEERAAQTLDGLRERLEERMNNPIISLRNARPGRGVFGI